MSINHQFQLGESINPQSTADLLKDEKVRELILLAGKDGTGKSSAIVSLAMWLEVSSPNSKFYIIDTENKIRSTLKSFGDDKPHNIQYLKCETMNDVTRAVEYVLAKHSNGDWLAAESLARIWERAQDLAYSSIAGVSKAEYLEKKQKGKGPIPQPGDFWNIAKGAYDGAFFDLLTNSDSLSSIVTTTVAKAKEASGSYKENVDRKSLRFELGIDCNLEGAPRTPYYVETLAMMEMKQGKISCRVIRDNNSVLEDPRVEFAVEGKKMWGMNFMSQCRGL
jgi:Cdc6-like AAA superfamily ATPase